MKYEVTHEVVERKNYFFPVLMWIAMSIAGVGSGIVTYYGWTENFIISAFVGTLVFCFAHYRNIKDELYTPILEKEVKHRIKEIK